MQILCRSAGPQMGVKRVAVAPSTPSASATTWLTSLCLWWDNANSAQQFHALKTDKQDRDNTACCSTQSKVKNDVVFVVLLPRSSVPTSDSNPNLVQCATYWLWALLHLWAAPRPWSAVLPSSFLSAEGGNTTVPWFISFFLVEMKSLYNIRKLKPMPAYRGFHFEK